MQPEERLAGQRELLGDSGDPLQERVLGTPVVGATEIVLDPIEQRGAVTRIEIAGVVHEAREAVHRLELPARPRRQQLQRNRKVLARGLGEDLLGAWNAGRRGGRRGRDGEPAPGHQSPETWMKTLRERARSSSQKKIFCQRPSIVRPPTIGIACDVEESSAARRCE